MTTTERGLFERITSISSGRINGDAYIISGLALNNVCAEHEQQLAAAREEVEGLKGRLSAQTDYAISLQRSIEHFCRGEKIPGPVAYGCQHHARMLNEKLTAPLPEKNPEPFTIDGKDPAEFFDELENKPEKNGS